jgi:hypothetical protein
MPITQALRMAIIDCLETWPGIDQLDGRKALVAQAGLDARLARRIMYSGPLEDFCGILVADLEEYGSLDDGRHALQALVQALASDGAMDCGLLLTDLKLQLRLIKTVKQLRARWYVVVAAIACFVLLLLVLSYAFPVSLQPILAMTPSPAPVETRVVTTTTSTPDSTIPVAETPTASYTPTAP